MEQARIKGTQTAAETLDPETRPSASPAQQGPDSLQQDTLYSVLMQAPALVTIFRGPEHRIELVNLLAQQFLNRHGVVGRTIREALPEVEGQGYYELLDTVYSTGQPYVGWEQQALVDRAGNGTLDEGYFNFIYHPLRGQEGGIEGVLALAFEVTQLVYARQRVVREEQRRTTQLQSLAAASLAINSARSLEEVLRVIAEQARLLIGAHLALTSLTGAQGLDSTLHAASRSDSHAAWGDSSAVPDGLVSRVCQENSPLRMTQAQLEAHPLWTRPGEPGASRPPIRGWLAVPLAGRDGRNLGLVQLADKREGEFTAEDEAILVQLAQLGSVAVENAQLTARLREESLVLARHARQAALAADIGGALTRASTLHEMLQRCTEAIVHHLGISCACVWTLEAADRTLTLQASAGPASPPRAPRASTPLDSSWLEAVTRHDRLLLTHGLPDGLSEEERAWAHAEGLKVFAGHPLVLEGRTIGVLSLFAHQPLSQDELDALAATADSISVGIERKRAEQALRLSEARFRSLVEAISQVFWTCTPDGRVTSPLPTWESFTSQAFEQYRDKSWLEAVHPEDRQLLQRLWEPTRAPPPRYDAECRVRRADGTYAWTMAYGAPVLDEKGHILEWVGMNIDVTERKLAQEALRESRERLVAALSASETGTFRWDLRTHALEWDENLDRLFGLVPGQTPRRLESFLAMVHPEDRPAVAERCEACAREGADLDIDFRVVRPSGEVRWVADKGKTLKDAAGTPLYMTGACVDITEMKRVAAERERLISALERSNAELDQFAYVASHDLKAPLRGIASLSQWLEEDLGPVLTPETREQMDLLRGRVHRMEALIDGILNYSRAGRVRHKSEVVDVRRLLSETVELLSPQPGILIEIAPDMPVLTTERIPLQQVFMNLIGNALKHARREAALVRVGVRDSGAFYDFSVSDNGQGIAPQYHEKIWIIFQTLEARDKVEGTGIGLSVVKKIVESRGGRAWVESAEGAGATFHFLWPKRDHPAG